MKGRAIKYSDAELVFIEALQALPRRDLHAEFCKYFGRDDVSVENLKRLCNRKGWNTGRTGQFPKGNVSHNKGKKGQCAPGSEKGWFKKGRMPHNHRGAGHERIDNKDGYVVMIVDEKNPWTGAATRPVHKHRYLWEKQNGPIPDGHVLKYLDGDKTNTDPSNWELIPQGMLPRLSGRWRLGYDQAEPEVRPTIMAVAKLEHQLREAKK